MNILSAVADLPILIQIAGGLFVGVFAMAAFLQIAIHFRVVVAIAVASITAYSQWDSGSPPIALPLAIGLLTWFVLRVLDVRDEVEGNDDVLSEQQPSSSSSGYNHVAEARRIEADYHRRQRENLFRR